MRKGFTVLYASLIGGLVLAVGAAILLITIKQVALSAAGRESQFAFYAADSATECALYLNKVSVSESCSDGIFAGPTTNLDACGFEAVSTSNIPQCFGQGLTLDGDQISDGNQGITVVDLGNTSNPSLTNNICAKIRVVKTNTETTITARGFSSCSTTGNRFERAIETTF